MAQINDQSHQRAGSWQTIGGTMRECSCGKEFFGSAETTFIARDEHIGAVNGSEMPA